MGEDFEPDHHALLNRGEDNEVDIFGYRTHALRRSLSLLGYTLSCGFLLLLFHWKPAWHVWATCVPCSLEDADVILLRTTDEFKQCSRKKVEWIKVPLGARSVIGQPSPFVTDEEKSIIYKAVKKSDSKVKLIRVQKITFVWINCEKKFVKAGVLEESLSCSALHSIFGCGLGTEERYLRKLICGPNVIEVEVAPIWKLLFKEVLNPFYAFEACSLALWLAVGYIEYSIAVIIMTLASILFTVHDLRKESVKLHKLVESNNSVVVMVSLKDGDCKEMESRHLVPGDTIILSEKRLFMPCDAILIQGSCVINESMLTGESIPVTKTALPTSNASIPWRQHSGADYKRHVLFCGTEVVQTKTSGQRPVKAVVLKTGFNTAKGDLVRSILYPKPMNFKLHRDAIRFLMVLGAVAVIGLIYTVVVFTMQGESVFEIAIKALIIITTAVPPALSAALSTGIMYAQRRLKKRKIFCISPERINVCGRLNLVCFDKTGTLTEDGLDLCGVIPIHGNSFQEMQKFPSGAALPWGPLLGAMTSCHSLITLDGKVQGDPLDLKMFESTNWEIKDFPPEISSRMESQNGIIIPGPNAGQDSVKGVTILHQFPFSSTLMRMSVVAQVIGGDERFVFMKGSPETVAGFCKPGTVPANFATQLEHFTLQGFRVIGLAFKEIDTKCDGPWSFPREEVESDLEYLGFLIFENRLKKETKAVLRELRDASIRTVMITGDNLQTAVTVAKDSRLVSGKVVVVEAEARNGSCPASIIWKSMKDHHSNGDVHDETYIHMHGGHTIDEHSTFSFAMTGKSYQVIVQYFSNLLPKLLLNGAIFARMSPGQKSSLIEEFQKLDYYVCMCGDGANDCGALKVAHAGISLSEQEASVASPFTSKTPNIECIPQLLKEGRAALVTSFCVFKYMTLYSMIQFTCMLLLYWQINILGNYQLLVQDVAVTVSVCLTMSLTHAYPKLAPYRPPAQLISPPLLLSVLLHTLFTLAIQICGFIVVQQQLWYSPTPSRLCMPLNTSFNGAMYNVNGIPDTSVTRPGGLGRANYSHISYETTTLWPLTTINCIIVAFVFSKGKPFRQPIYTNYIFSLLLVVLLAICIYLLFVDIENIYTVMELVCTPTLWRVYILVMLLIVFAASVIVEEAVVENRRLWLMLKRCFHYHSKSRYRTLLRDLEKDHNWPPLDRTVYEDPPAGGHVEEKCAIYNNPSFESTEVLEARRDNTHPSTSGEWITVLL
ncbi:hypothetical protein NDU88_000093 [Pleurodeles waltl]|uniref:Cation-transporting ATPase n=1 Tax=Pleurodeles waltl TaxID=8319 RepID=A0AAV7L971_PLEWA|nr:hypothetical protein NDU88_000093 [Pleurodeles waltl]